MNKKDAACLSDFGSYLRRARVRAGFTQLEVAHRLGLRSGQCISDWERNQGSGVPGQYLKRLIRLYNLEVMETFERLFEYQSNRLRERLSRELLSS